MSEFGSEKVIVLRWVELVVIQTRSIQPIFYTKSVELYFGFLTIIVSVISGIKEVASIYLA